MRKVIGLVRLLEDKQKQYKHDSLVRIEEHSFKTKQDVGVFDQNYNELVVVDSEEGESFLDVLQFQTSRPKFTERQLDACENLIIAIGGVVMSRRMDFWLPLRVDYGTLSSPVKRKRVIGAG